jgi:peroxiredoxin
LDLKADEMKPTLAMIKAHWFPSALVVVTASLVTQNLWLSQLNRTMRIRVDNLTAKHVSLGEQLGEVRGMTVSGDRIVKSAVGGAFGTLLVAMSANCGICAKNLASWDRLTLHARLSGLNVIWVSRDTVEQIALFAKQNRAVDVSLVAEPTYWTWQELKLGVVPQTIVADAAGVVRSVHIGELDGPTEEAINSAVDALAPSAVQPNARQR